jgi:hypothetical protein
MLGVSVYVSEAAESIPPIGLLTAAEAPGLPGVLKAAVLARGFKPRASGEPKARPLTWPAEPIILKIRYYRG